MHPQTLHIQRSTAQSCALAQGPSAICISSLCPKKNLVIWCHVSHPWLSHLPFTTSTSSSSFTLPSTTQEHAARSVQQEQLREHFVNEKRSQRPVCYDQQQIGGDPRHATPTFGASGRCGNDTSSGCHPLSREQDSCDVRRTLSCPIAGLAGFFDALWVVTGCLHQSKCWSLDHLGSKTGEKGTGERNSSGTKPNRGQRSSQTAHWRRN